MSSLDRIIKKYGGNKQDLIKYIKDNDITKNYKGEYDKVDLKGFYNFNTVRGKDKDINIKRIKKNYYDAYPDVSEVLKGKGETKNVFKALLYACHMYSQELGIVETMERMNKRYGEDEHKILNYLRDTKLYSFTMIQDDETKLM